MPRPGGAAQPGADGLFVNPCRVTTRVHLSGGWSENCIGPMLYAEGHILTEWPRIPPEILRGAKLRRVHKDADDDPSIITHSFPRAMKMFEMSCVKRSHGRDKRDLFANRPPEAVGGTGGTQDDHNRWRWRRLHRAFSPGTTESP